MTLLSIIIPNYNYGHFADRFYGSLAAQTMSLAETEIIFVDDGSSDDSLEQACKWAGILECREFKILTPPRAGRPGPVRNHGLEQATGKYLLCFDPDDEFQPEFLKNCIYFLESNPIFSVVYSDYLETSPDKSFHRFLPDFSPRHLRTQNTVATAALYRRELWDGGVRYRDNTVYEDWDYWVQCLMAGGKFKHIDQPLYIHHVHETNFSHQAEKEDGAAKARIVLNNPGFFHQSVAQWAADHLRGRAHAPSFQRGYIPTAEDLLKLSDMIKIGGI
ncbi:glycosyltransferase family 2 protein [Desulfovibrio sp. JC022]|uniref:glycosyltransferase family 2 protein n=1 Tax=Desulfovibrio sp. JC022 TaxID=2593642 RepID=UPI0013D224E2|nr:glycosyltransferase family 2 protein [Desulfovibrio sp. JC022]NDV21409.1 glycosyltransferase family 2 protein [Desulfovibrio sp. JC022]